MSADSLLTKLDGVRRAGPDRWIARCPGHDDRSPSMSIREMSDGRVLVKCFAGCSFGEIVAAAGVEISELFPPRPIEHAKTERRPFFPSDVFEIARREIGVAAIIAADMHEQREISKSDYKRLFQVVDRLNGIAGAAYGRI